MPLPSLGATDFAFRAAEAKAKLLRLLVPKAGAARPTRDNIVVAGLHGSPTGLGHSARLCRNALRDAGYDAAAIDLCDRLRIARGAAFDGGDISLRPGPGILILHINGPQVSRALWHLGRSGVRGKRIIGYWSWELESVPPDWVEASHLVHEVWAPTHFTGNALAQAIHCPVRVVPHILPATTDGGGDPAGRREVARAALNLHPSHFVVALGFAMLSNFERKNPLAAIAAFNDAFGDDPSAQLILRCRDFGAYPAGARRLREAIAGHDNIRLVTRDFVPMSTFIDAADLYLSLHRSEGFGLTLLEAMTAGKPVVATNWSGNTDFMTTSNSALIDGPLVPVEDPQRTYLGCGHRWADPDVHAAALALQRLRRDGELRATLGARAAAASRRFASKSREMLVTAMHAVDGAGACARKGATITLAG